MGGAIGKIFSMAYGWHGMEKRCRELFPDGGGKSGVMPAASLTGGTNVVISFTSLSIEMIKMMYGGESELTGVYVGGNADGTLDGRVKTMTERFFGETARRTGRGNEMVYDLYHEFPGNEPEWKKFRNVIGWLEKVKGLVERNGK